MTLFPVRQARFTDSLSDLYPSGDLRFTAFPEIALASANSMTEAGIGGYHAQAHDPAAQIPRLQQSLDHSKKPLPGQPTASRVEGENKGMKDYPATGQSEIPAGAARQTPATTSVYNALREFAQNGLCQKALKFENETNKSFAKK